jgi:NAD-dependent deacetylase
MRRQSTGDEFKVTNKPPRCKACKAILKPSVIFFGEAIPTQALHESERLANKADAILVAGTSAVVYPASSIPYMVKSNGGAVIEVNMESTGLTGSITDVFLKGRAGAVMPRLLEHLIG